VPFETPARNAKLAPNLHYAHQIDNAVTDTNDRAPLQKWRDLLTGEKEERKDGEAAQQINTRDGDRAPLEPRVVVVHHVKRNEVSRGVITYSVTTTRVLNATT